ncbi:MAG: sphingomyelin synthase family protein [Elusimicrobia bacterium]|nr:sphingomyelin synthase family protein [Elusimicrobiota bacterium]
MRPDERRPATAREYLVGGTALAAALTINQFAGRLADANGENAQPSPDLLLAWLPHWDTSVLFIYGFTALLLWLIFAGLRWERRRIPRILWAYAILVAVRSFFIILTPMHTPPDHAIVSGDPLFDVFGRFLTFKHDLFFSSHTATPFLAYLLFRDKWVSLSFLAVSILMAAAVLIGRFHYSIDVFAAFFITYAVQTLEARKIQYVYERLTGIRRD